MIKISKRYLLISTLVLFACGESKKEESKEETLQQLIQDRDELNKKIKALELELNKKEDEEISAKQVNVVKVEPKPFNVYLESLGKVDGASNLRLGPKVSGQVVAVYVRVGERVSKGQLLAQIDDGVVKNNFLSQEVQLKNAEILFNKYDKLYKEKVVSEVEWLEVKTNKESLEKSVESLRSQLKSYEVVAPVDGVLDEINLKVGQFVSPNFEYNTFSILNTNDLKFSSNISEFYVDKLQKGKSVVVDFFDLKKTYKSKVSFVSNSVDPVSRSYTVEVALPNSLGVKMNMAGLLKLLIYSNEQAITLPLNIIQKSNDKDYIFVVNEKKVKRTVVELGEKYNGEVEVLNGLQADDIVVTSGLANLIDGDTVTYYLDE